MKKFSVIIPIGAAAIIKVEANTKEEAIQKALEEGASGICHQCSEDIELGELYNEHEAIVHEIGE